MYQDKDVIQKSDFTCNIGDDRMLHENLYSRNETDNHTHSAMRSKMSGHTEADHLRSRRSTKTWKFVEMYLMVDYIEYAFYRDDEGQGSHEEGIRGSFIVFWLRENSYTGCFL